jgi:putative ABC transport system ATP-binding protein
LLSGFNFLAKKTKKHFIDRFKFFKYSHHKNNYFCYSIPLLFKKMSQQEIIRLTDITRTYKVGTELVRALRSISLSIYKNEFVALMGPSGSGKSTLMNLIGCLDTPTSGKYILNDQDVSKLNDNELARIRNKEIGFVFQTFNLLPRSTALENVMLPQIYAGFSKAARLERANNVISSVGLTDRAHHKPNELSGGQRQRVAIARALVNKPSIILADEPTGNLDSTTSYEIMGVLEQIHRAGNTIILVTHEEDIARHAHRIIRLMDGKVSADYLNSNIATSARTLNN